MATAISQPGPLVRRAPRWCLAWAAFLFALGIVGWGPAELSAQTGSPNLDRLVQLAMRQHPELDQPAAAVLRESGLRHQNTRRPNPRVGYAAGEIGDQGRAGQQGVYLSQEWVTAGKLGLADQVGHWRTTAANHGLEWSRLRLSRRVQSQYWSLVSARYRVSLLDQLEQLLQEAVTINQALVEAAEIGRGTVLQAKLELNQIAVAKRQAQIDLAAKTNALAATLGVAPDWLESFPTDPWPNHAFIQSPPTHPAPVSQPGRAPSDRDPPARPAAEREPSLDRSPTPSAHHFEMAIQGLWEEAIDPADFSPEAAQAQALVEAARWEWKLAEAQVRSNVDSFATVQHDAITNNVIVGLQIGMALPITDRKLGLVQAARASLAEAEAQWASRRRAIQARWAQAVGDYRAAREMIDAIDSELLALAQQRLQLARQAHQQGEIDYLDLLTAQRSYLSIQQTALEAQEQAALALVRLQTWAVED